MVVMRLSAASPENIVEHGEPLDLGHIEQTPPDRLLTGSRRTTQLVHEQALAAALNTVIMWLGDARDAGIPDFDESSVGDRESNPRAG